jgi:glycosyltransferase involved in cell wall biosynthesis
MTVGVGVDSVSIRAAIPFVLDTPVLLLMGRLESHKNYLRAIDAFARCKTSAQMVIVGTGPEKETIARRVQELGLAKTVRLLGYVEDAELRRWQRTAHVVMSLSSAESFGLTVAEASAAGARVIASDIPAHRDVAEIAGAAFRFVSLGASTEPPELTTWRQIGERVANVYERAVASHA